MKLYRIIHMDASEDGQQFYLTIAEARKDARDIAEHSGGDVEVQSVEFDTDKATICKIANGRGWVKVATTVYIAKPRRKA